MANAVGDRGWRRAVLAALVLVGGTVHAQGCELAEVRAAIIGVLDKDEAKAKAFAKQFKEGADPFTILDQMVSAEMAKKIDVCRFQAAEYLTKRGFPPSH